jgi:hypothetical protein
MANEVLVKLGSASPATITLTSLANNAAREGVKIDLGATFSARYTIEFTLQTGATAPTIGATYELWLGWSTHVTAGTDNPAGLTGADAAWTGIGSASVDESKMQLDLAGALVLVDETDTDMRQYFTVTAKSRYVIPVVVNKSGQTTHATGTNNTIVLTPLTDEVQ